MPMRKLPAKPEPIHPTNEPNMRRALLAFALTKPAGERAEFLDRECGDDKDLRQRLEGHAGEKTGE